MTAKGTHITIGPRERACINCGYYAQCYREAPIPGESYKQLIPVSFGWCTQREERRGPLHQPCKDFETQENPQR